MNAAKLTVKTHTKLIVIQSGDMNAAKLNEKLSKEFHQTQKTLNLTNCHNTPIKLFLAETDVKPKKLARPINTIEKF